MTAALLPSKAGGWLARYRTFRPFIASLDLTIVQDDPTISRGYTVRLGFAQLGLRCAFRLCQYPGRDTQIDEKPE
jgi:hypothetical protein